MNQVYFLIGVGPLFKFLFLVSVKLEYIPNQLPGLCGSAIKVCGWGVCGGSVMCVNQLLDFFPFRLSV